jgi:uracil-DNA glycosylase
MPNMRGDLEENFAYLREVLGVRYLPTMDVGHLESAQVSSNMFQEDGAGLTKPSTVSISTSKRSDPAALAELQKSLEGCTRCKLHSGRKTIVFGSGSPTARLMFVGEGPGEQEDLKGLPFVGPAGQLLTKMIEAMKISRDYVYIANVVKCRPPMNRNPETDEIAQCSPFLKKQIEFVNPEIIVALGTFAAQALLQTTERISRLRGTIHKYDGRKLIASFHPSYLLRNPSEKKAAWADLQLVMKELNLK